MRSLIKRTIVLGNTSSIKQGLKMVEIKDYNSGNIKLNKRKENFGKRIGRGISPSNRKIRSR